MTLKKCINDDDLDFSGIERPLSGQEIADILNVRRQAVSNILKRALRKVYVGMKKMNCSSPFETLVHLALGLSIPDHEIKAFYRLFPKDIRKVIKLDAKDYECDFD